MKASALLLLVLGVVASAPTQADPGWCRPGGPHPQRFLRNDGSDTVCSGKVNAPVGTFKGKGKPCAWKTFRRAVDRNSVGSHVVGGEVLCVMPGVYREVFLVSNDNVDGNFTADAPLRIVGMGATREDTEFTAFDPLDPQTVTKTGGFRNLYQFDLPAFVPGGPLGIDKGHCSLDTGVNCVSDAACSGGVCRQPIATMRDVGQATSHGGVNWTNGSDPYYRIHRGERASWCRSPTVAQAKAWADAGVGTLATDSGTRTIFFHPMNGACPMASGCAGGVPFDGIRREYQARREAANVNRAFVYFENLTFTGRADLSGPNAIGTNVRSRGVSAGGGLSFGESGGQGGFTASVYTGFLVEHGMAVKGSGTSGVNAAGLTLRGFDVSGGYDGVSMGRLRGTQAQPVLIDDLFSHDGWTNREDASHDGQDFYDCETGAWHATNKYTGAHGIYLGDSSSDPPGANAWVKITGSKVARQFDGFGVFSCDDCSLLNNTLGDAGPAATGGVAKAQRIQWVGNRRFVLANNRLFRNSGDASHTALAHLPRRPLSGIDTWTSDYNLFQHKNLKGELSVWSVNGIAKTLAQAKDAAKCSQPGNPAAACEGPHSREADSSAPLGFMNTAAGVDDYRLKPDAPAIDAGRRE